MARYVLRRLLYAVPTLVGVVLLTFVLFYASASPEQMARRNLTAKNPTKAQISAWLTRHGYDKPLSVQFKKHLSELLLLRFGTSDATGEDIGAQVKSGAGPSAFLAVLVLTTSVLVSVSTALGVAYLRGTFLDTWATFVSVLLMSVTSLVYIIAGQFILGKLLRYFPLAGYRSGADAFRFIVLPMTIGVVSGLGSSVRLYRTLMLEEMNQDYVRTARAKGLSEGAVLFRHVLKNAAIPIITSVVHAIPLLILGSLLLESFFGIPGLGNLLVDAIASQDFATVRAMVFIGTLLSIAGFILTDVAYGLVDPRVRLE